MAKHGYVLASGKLAVSRPPARRWASRGRPGADAATADANTRLWSCSGGWGQLGSDLASVATGRHELVLPCHAEVDITDERAVDDVVAGVAP